MIQIAQVFITTDDGCRVQLEAGLQEGGTADAGRNSSPQKDMPDARSSACSQAICPEMVFSGEMPGIPSQVQAQVHVSVQKYDGLQVLWVKGGFETHDPAFGYQKKLAAANGISVRMQLCRKGPFMADYQHKEWWMRPSFGTQVREVPENTQLLIVREDAVFHVFLAVCSGVRCDLSGTEEDLLEAAISSNLQRLSQIDCLAMVCGSGRDPYDVVLRCVRLALRLTGNTAMLREEKKFPELFEGLGWCTWDALRHDVSEAAIREKLEECREKGVPLRWVLIDDGWSRADFDSMELTGIDADPVRFPNGLKETVRMIKEDYGIAQVGVWQAIKGYWNGIAPGSEAFSFFCDLLEQQPSGEWTYRQNEASSFAFWSRWHRYLKGCGIDFAKVDSQSSLSIMQKGRYLYGSTSESIHSGLDASAAIHFRNQLINCMGMASEDIWHRPSSPLSRSSDDYTPTVAGSFGEHALMNSYNAILHGCFYYDDWDMVWSDHEEAGESILLRCLSGGPLYISDRVGGTDRKALDPAILKDGRVLRCDGPGRPLLSCLTDGGVLTQRSLLICNTAGPAVCIGAFTYAKETIQSEFSLSDIPACLAPELFGASGIDGVLKAWCYDWLGRSAKVLEGEEQVSVELTPGSFGLWQILPYRQICVLGLIDKYISYAGIASCEYLAESEGAAVKLMVKEDGVLGILTDTGAVRAEQQGTLLAVQRQDALFMCTVKAGSEIILRNEL